MPIMNKIQGQTYYCKMCFDAGKTELVYSSHCIRDSKRNITCPLLLSIKCRNCSKMGHTSKYCKVKSRPPLQVQKPLVEFNQEKPKKKQQKRGFAILTYESSSDDEPEHEPEPEPVSPEPVAPEPVPPEPVAHEPVAHEPEPDDNWSKYSGVDWNDLLSDDEFV